MRCVWKFPVLAAFSLLTALPAWAFHIPDASTPWPTLHQLELPQAEREPYAMNYADEAARTLGIEDGKWEAFSTRSRNPLMPSLRGGVEGGRLGIALQWRAGP